MKLALFCLCVALLVGCVTKSDVALTAGTELDLIHPIRVTHVGIFRDGGTVKVVVEGGRGRKLEAYIDHSISTSQNFPEDLSALWIDAYPKKAKSNRIEFHSDEARTILRLLESSLVNYSKEQVQDWSAQNEDLLRRTVENIKRKLRTSK